MSQQPLDFLKDYNIPAEGNDQKEAVAITSKPASTSNGTNITNGRKVLRRKKRVEVTKREQYRAQVKERRRQARQVIQVECKCHLSCPKRISPEQRKILNEKYWQLDQVAQRHYIKIHTVPGPVKRRRVPLDPLGGTTDVKKAFSYAFYLPDEHGELMMVCCTFFLNTLGFRKGCGNYIYRAHSRDTLADKRGKYERDRTLRDAVWDDILSYSPRTYHKGSKFSPTAMYLPTKLTAKAMHADFKARREAAGEKGCSASFYCSVLREIDVHFVDMDDFVIPERKPIPVVRPKPPCSPPLEPSLSSVQCPENVAVADTEVPKIEMMQDNAKPGCSYPSAIEPVYQPMNHVPVEAQQPYHQPTTQMHSYTIEQKPIVQQFVPGSFHANVVPFHSVTVKQEPYYGINSESVSVADSHFSEEHCDYSNMDADVEYSESNSYLEVTPYPVVEIVDQVEHQSQEFHQPFVKPELQPLNQVVPVIDQSHSEIPIPKPKPAKPKPTNPPNLDLDAIPEGYPPLKRSKKYIARLRNRVKRQQLHPVVHQGCNSCYLNCREKIPTEQQELINKRYWAMTFPEQRMFMLEHTERHSIKRRRAKIEPGSVVRKGYTYSYRLTDGQGQYQQVCCQFYLNTLGYGAGSGNLIYRAHQVELSRAISDNRGKFARDTTLRDQVDGDIMTYLSAELQESGGSFDLSKTNWSPKKMYNKYVEKQAALGNDKPGSFAFYWRRTRELRVTYAPKPEPKNPGQKKPRRRRPPVKQTQGDSLGMSFQLPSVPQ